MKRTMLALASLTLYLGAAPVVTLAADPSAASVGQLVTKVHEAVQYPNDKGVVGSFDFNNKDVRWVQKKNGHVFIHGCPWWPGYICLEERQESLAVSAYA
mgnify:FL=1